MFRHNFMTFGIGMKMIGEVQVRNANYAFKQERNKSKVIFQSQLSENKPEFGSVTARENIRDLHASQNDLAFRMVLFYHLNYFLQVLDGFAGGYAAQAIVSAQFQHKNIHWLFDPVINAVFPARRSFAAYARVYNL